VGDYSDNIVIKPSMVIPISIIIYWLWAILVAIDWLWTITMSISWVDHLYCIYWGNKDYDGRIYGRYSILINDFLVP